MKTDIMKTVYTSSHFLVTRSSGNLLGYGEVSQFSVLPITLLIVVKGALHVKSIKNRVNLHDCHRFRINLICWFYMSWQGISLPLTIQLFREFSLNNNTLPENTITKIELCVASIHQWMETNKLKLNDDNTKIVIILLKSAHQSLLLDGVIIGNIHITPNTHAINLRVIFDSNMTLERHITNFSKTAFSTHLHSVVCTRRYLKQTHTKQLVHCATAT